MGFKDYYGILNICPLSNIAEIKNAYRKLVNLHHPDKHPQASGGSAPFLNIREAYDVLSDSRKRKEYDRIYEKEMNVPKRTASGFAETTRNFGDHRTDQEMGDLIDEIFSRFLGRPEKRGLSRKRPGDGTGHIHYDDLL